MKICVWINKMIYIIIERYKYIWKIKKLFVYCINKQKQNKMTKKENDDLQKELDYQMELFHKKRREVYEKEQKELDELMKQIDELN